MAARQRGERLRDAARGRAAPAPRWRARTGRTRSPATRRHGRRRRGSARPRSTRPSPPIDEPHDVPSLHAPDYGAPVTRTTVFGAGAMGTAVAMHAARQGHDVALWGSSLRLLGLPAPGAPTASIPSCPSTCPPAVRLCGPDELEAAAEGAAVRGARARTPTGRGPSRELIRAHVGGALVAISVAKGLEPGTGKRMSQVYGEELAGVPIVTRRRPVPGHRARRGAPDRQRVGRAAAGTGHAGRPRRSTDRPTSSPTPTT